MPFPWSDVYVAFAVWAMVAALAAVAVFTVPLWGRRHQPRHRRPAWWRGSPPRHAEVDQDPPVGLSDLIR
jgi:hypothetical protein